MEKSENIKDMSIYETSDFWDEHDFGEFDDVQEEKEMQFLLKKKKYVGIDTDLYAIIKSKAKALNKGDALINEWLSEKVSVWHSKECGETPCQSCGSSNRVQVGKCMSERLCVNSSKRGGLL